MKQEMIFTGKTVASALEEAAEQLSIEADKLTYEVLEQEKAGFLGIGAAPAKIKVTYTRGGDVIAQKFIETLLSDMELDAKVELKVLKKSDRELNISGEAAGVLIGHHGDTLDALQYLANLAANKREEDESRDYVHITVDVENYRAKREETLRALAWRMAERVKKYKKSIMLEPMPPYERRIIHSEVQNIEGVSTNSIGTDSNRRVVIYLESEGFNIPKNAPKELQNPKSSSKSKSSRAMQSDEYDSGARDSRSSKRRTDKSRSSQISQSKRKPKPAKYQDGDDISAEELSELISTYGSKDKPLREQPAKFKSFDDYLSSLTNSTGGDTPAGGVKG